MHPFTESETISTTSVSFQSCDVSGSSSEKVEEEREQIMDRSVRDVLEDDDACQTLLELMVDRCQQSLLTAQHAAKKANSRTERQKKMLVVLYSELDETRRMKDAATHLEAMLDSASQSVGDQLITTLHEKYPEFESHLAQAFPAWNAQLCGATNAARLAELAADLLFKKKVVLGLETVVKARYSQLVNTKKQKKVFRKKQKAFRKKRDRGVKIKDCGAGRILGEDPESGEGILGGRDDADDGDDDSNQAVPMLVRPAPPPRPSGSPASGHSNSTGNTMGHNNTGSHSNASSHSNTGSHHSNAGSHSNGSGRNAEQVVAAARRSGRIKQTLETAL